MDGVKVMTEGISSIPGAQVQNQPELRTREAKCNKTVEGVTKNHSSSESNSHCTPYACGEGECKPAVEKLADDLGAMVNLESEHCVNGLTNGVSQGTTVKECKSDPLLSGRSSPCECESHISGLQSTSCQEVTATDSSAGKELIPSLNIIKGKTEVEYVSYESELQMPDIMRIMNKDLSEPYSIYTYRYFIYNWPKLCFLAMIGSECVGAIVCKLDLNRKAAKRGYIAMLAVDGNHRNKGIGSNLVLKAIGAMVALNADEVVLESEITNSHALRLYENLGFVRDKRLFRYYLNGVDAFRLKLWLK